MKDDATRNTLKEKKQNANAVFFPHDFFDTFFDKRAERTRWQMMMMMCELLAPH
jgi:hypothetical protein